MSAVASSTIPSIPQLLLARSKTRQAEQTRATSYLHRGNCVLPPPLSSSNVTGHLSALNPRVFGIQLRSKRGGGLLSLQRQSAAAVCCAALNARCSAEQTQTITHKAPTITQAPTHIQEKSPQLDDGGTGFPPRDDGDGGGGGGGGGGNWSGGFFFFGFLAFLGFLKDKESDGDYREGRRR
ncbi:hypothetical protein MLD38_015527 [Melastoma candidum]|uniref:Uncharacterized protein n=1 Tax=Melastoma candidum TaxID=119954 RepID=A0ACB9RGF9_9MYRT|nr:hypothetical protein MLD38_015527 [Melastoma candidum]